MGSFGRDIYSLYQQNPPLLSESWGPHLQAAEIDIKYLGHVCGGLAEYLKAVLGADSHHK